MYKEQWQHNWTMNKILEHWSHVTYQTEDVLAGQFPLPFRGTFIQSHV